jgi:hypothetical protein
MAVTELDKLDAVASSLCTDEMSWSYSEDGYTHCDLYRISPERLRELAGQEAEIARLREALTALVETEPTYDDEGVGTRCGYCSGRRRYLSVTATTIDHKDSCPWLKAKALLP